MAKKVVFILGLPEEKKHSVKFTQIGDKVTVNDVANGDVAVDRAEVFEQPVGMYIPKPFGKGSKKFRVTIEEVE